MKDFQDLVSLVLEKSTIDWLQACEVFEIAKFDGGCNDLDENRKLSVKLIRELIENGQMVAGDVTDLGFVSWSVDVDTAIERIDKEWAKVGEPTHGDVCWLNLTHMGWSAVSTTEKTTN